MAADACAVVVQLEAASAVTVQRQRSSASPPPEHLRVAFAAFERVVGNDQSSDAAESDERWRLGDAVDVRSRDVVAAFLLFTVATPQLLAQLPKARALNPLWRHAAPLGGDDKQRRSAQRRANKIADANAVEVSDDDDDDDS